MITLSRRAATYLKQALKGKPEHGVRVGVRKAGCSGFEYTVDFAIDLGPGEFSFNNRGVRIIVVQTELEQYLQGTQIDYQQEGLNAGLKFDNPNAESYCGCGESFNLKKRSHDDD